MKYYPENHLISLYEKWKQDPKRYDAELATLVDKYIYASLRTKPNRPIYTRIEDHDDFVQDLRLKCLGAWNRIEDPTNKRINNLLKVTISGAIKDKHKDLKKKKRNGSLETTILMERKVVMDFIETISSPQLQAVATLKMEGYSQKEISTALKISTTEVSNRIKRLRTIYEKE